MTQIIVFNIKIKAYLAQIGIEVPHIFKFLTITIIVWNIVNLTNIGGISVLHFLLILTEN
jgi:hypothetical protein